ncbi:hypothetical protein Peur_002313 [Populus x canadensis]
MAVDGHSIASGYLALYFSACLIFCLIFQPFRIVGGGSSGVATQNHALVEAKNLKLLMGGKELKMSTYKPGAAMEIVSLGRKEAVARRSFRTMIGKFPGMIKSKDLLVGKTRKYRGV